MLILQITVSRPFRIYAYSSDYIPLSEFALSSEALTQSMLSARQPVTPRRSILIRFTSTDMSFLISIDDYISPSEHPVFTPLPTFAFELYNQPFPPIDPAHSTATLPPSTTTTMRHPTAHALIGAASTLPSRTTTPTISFSPFTLSTPSRPVDLQLRITFPHPTPKPLPLILLSHGQGYSNHLSSLNGYGPLVTHLASRGFCVIQPTHLSSKVYSLPKEADGPLFFAERVQDMRTILDRLEEIEAGVPGLGKGAVDREQVAVMGHSAGSHTAAVLMGAKVEIPGDERQVYKLGRDERVKAGVLLTPIGAPGKDGEELSEFARRFEAFKYFDLGTMEGPVLTVAGEADLSRHLTSRGVDWHWDSYTLGKGSQAVVKVKGAKHILGGISGWDAEEAAGMKDENVEIAEGVMRATWAWLAGNLGVDGGESWEGLKGEYEKAGLGSVEEKS